MDILVLLYDSFPSWAKRCECEFDKPRRLRLPAILVGTDHDHV